MFILTWSAVFLFYLSICNAGSPCPTPDTTLKKCDCTSSASSTLISSTEITSAETSSTDKTAATIFLEGKFLNEINSTEGLTLGKLPRAYPVTTLKCGESSKPITTFSELQNDLSQFQNKMIDELILTSIPKVASRDKSLKFPSSLFQNIRIRQIQIKNTRLSPGFISTGIPFDNQVSLISLSAQNCELTGPLTYDSCGTVLTKNLEKVTNLQTLDLSDNFITCVASTAFSNPPTSLKEINLSKNDISYIFPGAFKKVSRLQKIDLSENFIQFQPKDIFPNPANDLETINLGSNLIKSLPEDFFSNMPALKNVNLKDNRLHSLPEKVWSGIWPKLTTLDVSGHIIECNCDLLWIVNPKFKTSGKISGHCTNYNDPDNYELQTLKKNNIACQDAYL